MSTAARETALRVLVSCRKGGAWADGALKTAIAKDRLTGADAALATRLVYGVVQNRAWLDFRLGEFCSQKVEKLEPVLLDILRLGAYQILFLDRVPDSAAVNEAVNQAKGHRMARAAGLVNAVLRKLSAHKDQPPRLPENPADRLSLLYSHPRWLTERLLELVGEEETEAFLREDNGTPPVYVQTNPLRTTAQALAEELSAAGVTVVPHPWLPGCLQLSGTGDLTALPAFQEGRLLVQDPAAHLAVLAAAPRPGDRVIDTCAAPGGKSFAAAMEMEGRGEILSCDLHAHKLRLIEAGAARLGISCIRTLLADGRVERPELLGSADVVIVDAPCSGLGIIRKKPDIRQKKAQELQGLPQIQRDILANAAKYVRPGGTLLYSTCTILPEENEGVTDAFLDSHPDFSRENFTLPHFGQVAGQLTFWPQRHGTDGFYVCRMKRKML